jgi:SAM-dependent methyltransferase
VGDLDGGSIAPDGSPVDVYRRLPAGREPAIIHAAIPAGASILELGCGTGRVTRPLAALGHAVTAVDHSPAMLDGLGDAPGVTVMEADIATLELGRTWDAVVLGSHFIDSEPPLRDAVLDTCRRHVDPDGLVLLESYPPGLDWPAAVGRRSMLGPVGITVVRAEVDGHRLDATMRYDVDGRTWSQHFRAVLLEEDDIVEALEGAGLAFRGWLDRPTGWLAAGPA